MKEISRRGRGASLIVGLVGAALNPSSLRAAAKNGFAAACCQTMKSLYARAKLSAFKQLLRLSHALETGLPNLVLVALCASAASALAAPSAQPALHAEARCLADRQVSVEANIRLGHDSSSEPASGGCHCWQIDSRWETGNAQKSLLRITFRYLGSKPVSARVALRLDFEGWSRQNYVLFPGAVYDGNRFRIRPMSYPPFPAKEDRGPDQPITVIDIPHLPHLDLSTGELSAPAFGVYLRKSHRVLWLLTDQGDQFGNHGFRMDESAKGSHATLWLESPQGRRSFFTLNSGPKLAHDAPAELKSGNSIVLEVRLWQRPASRLQDLFKSFWTVRAAAHQSPVARAQLPFSEAWKILQETFNQQNWSEAIGLYRIQFTRRNGKLFFNGPYDTWQLGWIGGLQQTLPMLAEGSELSRAHALRTMETVFSKSQAKSGFFYTTTGDGEHWFSDILAKPLPEHLALVRKEGDALFFILRQFEFLKRTGSKDELADTWKDQTRRLADALVSTWQRNGQFGNFINVEDGSVGIGGTSSGGIVPAGLVLAAEYFHDPAYLKTAEASAEQLYQRNTRIGLTTGGPGDAMQAPESESAYGLIQSYMALYEQTPNPLWLRYAREAGDQFATWVMTYDYAFPPQSTFARLGMQSTGAVWANAQNRVAPPGICTSSGEALLKLYRATNDNKYLYLLRDIAHALPQFLSRADRPIDGIQDGRRIPAEPGWLWERVQTTDWELPDVPQGETFYAASWPEVSLMLTYIDLPGVYIAPDSGLVVALDHVSATVVLATRQTLAVRLKNETNFNADIRVLAENAKERRTPLGYDSLIGARKVRLGAGESLVLRYSRETGAAD